jgi:hypothetical protein
MKTLRLPDKEASYIYKWISMKVFLLSIQPWNNFSEEGGLYFSKPISQKLIALDQLIHLHWP